LYHGKLRAGNPIKALYNRGKRGKREKKTVILQRILSISLLERSEKDLVLLHLQCNSQKIFDFLWSRSETREAKLGRRNSGGWTSFLN